MKGPSTWIRLLAALAVASTGRALAVDMTGTIGAGYSRSDTSASDVWGRDFVGDLTLSGAPLRPGLLQWQASGDYRTAKTLYSDGTSRSDNFGYRLGASAFTDGKTPVSLGASRGWLDFTSNLGSKQTGASLVTTETGTAMFRLEGLPTLQLAVNRTDTSNRSFGAAETRSQNTALSVSAAQNLSSFDYALGYDTSWSEASFAETNYQSHAFTLDVHTRLSELSDVRVTERYYTRLPTREAPQNPRYDDNTLRAACTWRSPERHASTVSYDYRRFVTEIPESADTESMAHQLAYGLQLRHGPEIDFFGSANAAYGLERVGSTEQVAASQAVGGGVGWHRPVGPATLLARGGASLGLAEPSAGRTELAYGADAMGGLSASTSRNRGAFSYSGSYARNTGAKLGSTLTHRLDMDGETLMARAVRLRATLALSASWREGSLLGTSRNRAAQLTVGAYRPRINVQLTGGVTDGLSEALASPAGGLVLPVRFNTVSRFATLTSTATVAPKLQLTGIARYLETTSPGRAAQHEKGLGVLAAYSFGAFTLSFEDRYSVGGTGGATQNANLLFARLTRSFGSRF